MNGLTYQTKCLFEVRHDTFKFKIINKKFKFIYCIS